MSEQLQKITLNLPNELPHEDLVAIFVAVESLVRELQSQETGQEPATKYTLNVNRLTLSLQFLPDFSTHYVLALIQSLPVFLGEIIEEDF